MTLRAHMDKYRAQAGKDHPMITNGPVLVRSSLTLWNDFMSLHRKRGEGDISYLEIDAYERVHDIKFDAWELEALARADSAYLAQRAQ